jgi:hypothetical protein
MSNTTPDANITAGTAVTLTLTDGNTVAGHFVSINSKGWNIKLAGGKVITRAQSRVARVDVYTIPDSADDLFAGYNDDDSLTTTALAAIFGTNAKALRVGLRAAGLGVGKGRTYALTPADVRPLADAIKANIPA